MHENKMPKNSKTQVQCLLLVLLTQFQRSVFWLCAGRLVFQKAARFLVYIAAYRFTNDILHFT